MAAKEGKKPRAPRNPELIRRIQKYSRSVMYHKRGLWAIKARNGGNFPVHLKAPKAPKPELEPSKWYPAKDEKTPIRNRRENLNRPSFEQNITPGIILILLARRFKGKRVVFLKQLESGLLLITDPFKVNGVPIRRVDQAYVIAASTKVDMSDLDVSKFTNSYFKNKKVKKKKTEGEFFARQTEQEVSVPL